MQAFRAWQQRRQRREPMSNEAMTAELEKLVAIGDMEHVGKGADGEQRYRLTKQGTDRVEAMIAAGKAVPDSSKEEA
jgi:hypothetical protein